MTKRSSWRMREPRLSTRYSSLTTIGYNTALKDTKWLKCVRSLLTIMAVFFVIIVERALEKIRCRMKAIFTVLDANMTGVKTVLCNRAKQTLVSSSCKSFMMAHSSNFTLISKILGSKLTIFYSKTRSRKNW